MAGTDGPVWHTLSAEQVLRTFSDKTFNIATGVSVLTLLLATVFGPLETFLKTTSLDVQQWLICTSAALSIIVVSEIRKAVRRRTGR